VTFKRLEVNREVQHTVLTREPDGDVWHHGRHLGASPVGVSSSSDSRRPADARGRGLGKWIKAAMLLTRELYPDTKWIGTGNAGRTRRC